jgi:hypothetical protein
MVLNRKLLVPRFTWLSVFGAIKEPVIPFNGDSVIFPVVFPPRVRVLLFNAWIVPAPLSAKPVVPFPFCAEMEATGDVVFTPVNANLADAVAFAPRSKSCVCNRSTIAPFNWLNGDPPLATANTLLTLDALDRSSALALIVPPDAWTTPLNPVKVIVPLDTVKPLLAVNSPLDVNVPAPVRFAPLAVNAVVPFGANTIFPVPAAPRVNVWLFVVPTIPPPVRYAAVLATLPAIEAVGVPLFTFTNANFALVVALAPKSKSWVSIFGVNTPFN